MGTEVAVNQQKIMQVNDPLPGYTPVRIVEVELGQALPTISAFDDKKKRYYQRASCHVRLHTQPLGLVELKFAMDELSPDEYVSEVWQALNVQINDHLRQDGLPSVTELTANGLSSSGTPCCVEERERFLADAPFVSVIVPTHERPEQLEACLSSLMSLCYPHYEVIVVDNAPGTNATEKLVQKFVQSASFIRYVREDRPGPSWARNRGIMVAQGKILAFTDDDVVVDPYWLVGLVRGFGVAENVACVTGLVLPLELETPAQFLFEEYGGFNKGFTSRIFKTDRANHYAEMPLYPYIPGRFGTGASMAFTADFLHKIGGFDPVLGGNGPSRNGQDIEVFFQVIIKGYNLVYQPEALLYHLHRRDYAVLCTQIYRYGIALTAFLTKVVLENPLLLLDLITKVPFGLFFILNSRSSKNSKKSPHYPKELTILERKGMLYGPFAYVRSGWEMSKLFKTLTLDERHAVTSVEGSSGL